MKKNLLLLSFWLLPLLIWAQAPAGYYTNADGKSGAELKTALFGIIGNHTVRSYDNLWTDFQTTDKKANGKVWDMYSDIPGGTPAYEYTFVTDQCGNYSGENNCYNREHSFPKSWFAEATPMYSDLFHLYPTDGYVNGKRSNYIFGEVSSATWQSTNGSMLGTADPTTNLTGTVFEPIDTYKGDFARTYFYMATCYEDKITGWASIATEAQQILAGNSYPAYKEAYVQLLLKWAQSDPVSQKEIDRNNAVYGIQKNRNPYIDHPEYAEYVWGGQTPSGVSISALALTPEFPNETNTVSLSATVIGKTTISVVKLKWGNTPAMESTEIAMTKTTGDTYQTATPIPAQALNTTVYYSVFAQDVDGGSSTTITKTYKVGNSLVISNLTTTPTAPNETNTVLISAKVNSATALNSVTLFWGLTATPTTEIAMSTTGGDIYTATIPAQAVSAKVYYYISATNTTPATEKSTTESYTVANSVAPTNLLSEDFVSCLPSDWLAYSVASNKNWACVSNAFEINGFGGDVASEDWLITKKVDATNYKSIALSFKVKTKFTDANYPNTLTVCYSTDYSGTGNPNTATWNKLTYTVPASNSNAYVSSGNIDLTSLEGKQFYIGFKYVSSGTTAGSASLWGVDDILLVGTSTVTNQAPTISAVVHTPTSPAVGTNVTYSANVTDADGSISSVSLNYGQDPTSLDQSATMTLTSGNTYSATVEFPNVTKLYYEVEATDNLNLATTSATITVTAATTTNQAPTISNISVTPSTPQQGASITIGATATDSDGSIAVVNVLHGTSADNLINSLTMILVSGSNYSTTVTAPQASTLFFKVETMDNLGLKTTSEIQTVNLTTGVEQTAKDIVTLYPNPATNELAISLANHSGAKVGIYELTGKQVAQKMVASGETIDISALRNGIYMVRIETGNTVITKKITVSR
ncbi:endonuclease [Williamwhitmania taraxaci]|uniref:Por secretion system C-terminal sorting domain-containing protein n=1 Tax=Williamwhitmania taraxaci TaxID=1640674 RepID=A0A1G6HA40_9BACT|nr:endonuclease [Williamwhitmania taraxaci]SDB90306.1 Por secretion system C-terminal sorting domain-containing protein [Williamwhitmania taraxaci]